MLDMQFNIGQVATTIATSAVAYGLRQIYGVIHKFLKRMDDLDSRVECTEDIADGHTDALKKAGLLLGDPRYTRRFTDRWGNHRG